MTQVIADRYRVETLHDEITHAQEPAPLIEEKVPNLPPRLVSLMHAMLEKDSAKRIRDMNIVAQELDAIFNEVSLS